MYSLTTCVCFVLFNELADCKLIISPARTAPHCYNKAAPSHRGAQVYHLVVYRLFLVPWFQFNAVSGSIRCALFCTDLHYGSPANTKGHPKLTIYKYRGHSDIQCDVCGQLDAASDCLGYIYWSEAAVVTSLVQSPTFEKEK